MSDKGKDKTPGKKKTKQRYSSVHCLPTKPKSLIQSIHVMPFPIILTLPSHVKA